MSPVFPPVPPSTEPPPMAFTTFCLCPWAVHTCIYVLQLIPSSLPPLPSPRSVALFYGSLPLVLFHSSLYIIHQIPHMSEIICYLSFSDWRILFSLVIFKSIHAVAKGKSFLFFYSCIVFCSVNAPQLFYPLSYSQALGLFLDLGYCK